MPAVSVVIPTHNRPDFVSAAIASVLNQTFQDFELIVVDDASCDRNAAAVVTHFGDTRIRYIRHEINKGLSAARNTGILASVGRYIAFLDDDDEWLPEKLAMQVAILERSPRRVGVVYTGCLLVDKATDRVFDKRLPTKKGDLFGHLMESDCVIAGGSSTLIRRYCFEQVGLFDENVPTWEAYDMWIRLSKSFEFEYVEKALVKYHSHGNRINTNCKDLIKGIELVLERYKHLFAKNKKGYSRHFLSLGVRCCLDNDVEKGKWRFLERSGYSHTT